VLYRLWMVVCTLVFVAHCALGANKPPQCHRPPQAPVVAAQPAGEKVIKTMARDSGTMGAQKTCPCSDACSCGCQEGQECGCGAGVTTTRYYTVLTPMSPVAPTFAQAPAFQPAYNYQPAFQPAPMPTMNYGGGGGFRGSRGGSCGGGG
jgi:hypothetical protein